MELFGLIAHNHALFKLLGEASSVVVLDVNLENGESKLTGLLFFLFKIANIIDLFLITTLFSIDNVSVVPCTRLV